MEKPNEINDLEALNLRYAQLHYQTEAILEDITNQDGARVIHPNHFDHVTNNLLTIASCFVEQLMGMQGQVENDGYEQKEFHKKVVRNLNLLENYLKIIRDNPDFAEKETAGTNGALPDIANTNIERYVTTSLEKYGETSDTEK